MRFSVEAWDPGFGSANDLLDDEIADPTETGHEVASNAWAPVDPRGPSPDEIAFVDGVIRVDAQVWINDDPEGPKPGLCTSIAAGEVRCDAAARIGTVEVRRVVLTGASNAEPIQTRHATYEAVAWAGELDALMQATTDRMRKLEAQVARSIAPAPLVVLDGLLWGREEVTNVVGYVKSHHRRYLEDEHEAVVHALAPGQRTPIFLLSTRNRSCYSWYLRLPGGTGHPKAGIVRCEASPDDKAHAITLADATATTLPRFASEAFREARAPQNLYPIAGLEKELRRRMGDARLLERSLRAAAAGTR